MDKRELVMYDATRYKFDETGTNADASISGGALLYRIASEAHWDHESILTGAGAKYSAGRFHVAGQPTSYCATSCLVSISELLFHRYNRLLKLLAEKAAHEHLLAHVDYDCMLVVVRVADIENLVHAESTGSRTSYDARVGGTALVNPLTYYGPLQEYATHLREKEKQGIFYPSARCCRDYAIALFGDKTELVDEASLQGFELTLSLVKEDQDLNVEPQRPLDPYTDKVSPTTGYYAFQDSNAFEEAKGNNLIHPSKLGPSGYVSFVRGVSYKPESLIPSFMAKP